MASIDSKGGQQYVALDDSDCGEGLSIFFSQEGGSTCRYRVLVKAEIDQGIYDMGEFFISPPLATDPPGRLSRMVAGAVCPGAVGWSVGISAVPGPNEEPIPEETADIVLASSKCCTSPVGVSRVSERYNYETGVSPGNNSFRVLAGMTVTGIAVYALAGGGSVAIAGGSTILIPAGVSVNLAPGATIPPNSSIGFANCNWTVEYLESA